MLSYKCRILCIDDNDDTCFMLTSLLQPQGHEVITASSITKALRMARSEHFDLYILDNRLPDGSGVELCQQLREFDLKTPIIIFSGAAHETDKREGLRAGATAYVAKPKIDGLTDTVHELLVDRKCMSAGAM